MDSGGGGVYTRAMSEGTQRRLAAIVAADVVGYSRLMGADEARTLAALRSHRGELIDGKIAEHGGRIVKTMGDGLLLEFPSVVDATQCVIDVQQAMGRRNEAVEEDKRIVFRIGVHLGDLVVEGDDIFGDGINIAARLEAICEAGGVAISGTAHENIAGRIEVGFVDAGDQQLKNISRPVRVWQWTPTTSPVPTTGEALALPDKPAIAVLPFDNMSGAAENDYLGDGLTEEIITALADWRLFPVIARNSTFIYKGTPVDVKTVGQELGARYVVEGSFRVAGHRIRVIAQLIDASSGHHVWTDRYDRELDDIFDLQEEVARAIAGAIEPELMQFEHQRIERNSIEDLSAWEQYLAGLNCLYNSTREDLEKGTAIFEAMRQRYPDYSMSHTGWSLIGGWRIQSGYLAAETGRLEAQLEASQRGVELDRNNSVAYVALVNVLWRLGRYEEAINAGNQSISLNPSSAMGRWMMGVTLDYTGHHHEAIEQLLIAEKLSPRDPVIWLFRLYLALAHFQIREHDKAIKFAQQVLRERPRQQGAKLVQAAACAYSGRLETAKEALSNYMAQAGSFNYERVRQVFGFSDPAKVEYFMEGLRQAGLREE